MKICTDLNRKTVLSMKRDYHPFTFSSLFLQAQELETSLLPHLPLKKPLEFP